MDEPPRHLWIAPAVVLGIGYALVGIGFARPATHGQAWRVGAWAVSALGYAVHIAYRAVSPTHPTSIRRPAHRCCRRAWIVRARRWGQRPFPVYRIDGSSSTAPAALAWDLAGDHGRPRLSCRPGHTCSSRARIRTRARQVASRLVASENAPPDRYAAIAKAVEEQRSGIDVDHIEVTEPNA